MPEEAHNYIITAIAPQDLDLVWDDVKGYIEAAMKRGPMTHSLDDVYLEVASGRRVLWVISDAERAYGACIAWITEWPLVKRCTVCWCGGEHFKYWIMNLLARIRAWARMNQASQVEVIGRRGWIKACGFTEDYSHMYMEA